MRHKLLLLLLLLICLGGGGYNVYRVYIADNYAHVTITLPASPYPPSPKPSEEEFARIEQLANAGDAQSQVYMGIFYANGDLAEQGFPLAAEWYRKAAEQGNARAQYYLGMLYDCGVGVDRQSGADFFGQPKRSFERFQSIIRRIRL